MTLDPDKAVQHLREVVDERVAAVRAKHIEPLRARMADDVVGFNVLPPLHLRGADAVIEQTQAWFDSYPGPISYDVEQVAAHAHGEVGFVTFLYHVGGTLADGSEVDMWVRATLGCRVHDGRWQIVHDHESVPFDPTTGQALLGLRP